MGYWHHWLSALESGRTKFPVLRDACIDLSKLFRTMPQAQSCCGARSMLRFGDQQLIHMHVRQERTYGKLRARQCKNSHNSFISINILPRHMLLLYITDAMTHHLHFINLGFLDNLIDSGLLCSAVHPRAASASSSAPSNASNFPCVLHMYSIPWFHGSRCPTSELFG